MKHVVLCTDAEIKFAILEAMDRLMEETPLDSLTVTSICRESGVSRQTFYRHFRDKYGVAEWYWELVIGNLELKEAGLSLTCYESMFRPMEAFLERRSFFSHALQSEGHHTLIEFGRDRRRQYLIDAVIKRTGMKPSEAILFEIDFFVDAESRAIAAWAIKGAQTPPERLCRLLEECIPRGLHRILALSA